MSAFDFRTPPARDVLAQALRAAGRPCGAGAPGCDDQGEVPGMSRQAAAVIGARVFRVSPEGDLDVLTRPVTLITRGES